MRIAYVTYSDFPESAAVAHRLQMLAKGLVYWGHEAHIIVPYKLTEGPLIEDIGGVQVHWGCHKDREDGRGILSKISKRIILISLTRRLLKEGLDWVILYNMGVDMLPFLVMAKAYNCSVAAETVDIRHQGVTFTIRNGLDILLYKISDYVLAPRVALNLVISRFLDRHFQEIAPEVPREIITAPVDVEKYYFSQQQADLFRKKFGLKNSFVLMYAGSLWSVKGGAIVIKALQRVLKEGKKAKLVITGATDYYKTDENLKELLSDSNLEEDIIFTGYLPENEIVSALSAADILIEAKTDHIANMAAFPQKLAEYLAMGKPIAASAIGDIPWYLTSGENAILCEPGDPVSLGDALVTLMDDPRLRKRLSERARQTATTTFDCRIVAKKMEAAFLKAMAHE